MRALYTLMLVGLAITFLLLIATGVAAAWPTGVPKSTSISAIPEKVGAGALVSYEINGCEEGKFKGVTSVNLQSTDSPPSITVAVAAPSPQDIHCHNVILVPLPMPTGSYRLIVFIDYDVNPIRNLLAPERREYISNKIYVTNPNPDFKLPVQPSSQLKSARPSSTTQTPIATESNIPQQSTPQIAQQPAQAPQPAQEPPAPQPSVSEESKPLVPTLINQVTGTVNKLLGGVQ